MTTNEIIILLSTLFSILTPAIGAIFALVKKNSKNKKLVNVLESINTWTKIAEAEILKVEKMVGITGAQKKDLVVKKIQDVSARLNLDFDKEKVEGIIEDLVKILNNNKIGKK